MEAVLMSIQPKWVEKIANGEKTIEVRKTAPKIETPFKCYIYMTNTHTKISLSKDNYAEEITVAKKLSGSCGKVISEFVCDKVKTFNYITKRLDNCEYKAYNIHNTDLAEMCLSKSEVWEYGKGKSLYGLHISNFTIYDTPKELGEFKGRTLVWRGMNHIRVFDNMTRPPQSWCYVEELSI